MRSVLDFFLNIVRFHKAKIFLFVALTFVFIVLKFPYGDLTSFMTARISQITQGQVFIASRDLGLTLLPHPGVRLSEVSVQAAPLPLLTADAVTIRPLPLNFPAGVLQAEGLAGGDATLKFGTEAAGSPEQKNELELTLQNISLAQLTELLSPSAPLAARGSAQAFLDLAIPRSAPHSLSGLAQISISQFSMPTFTASTPMGPLEVPALSFSQLQSTAQIENGIVNLQNLSLGAPGEPVSGTVSGTLTLSGARGGLQVSSYDLNLDITFSQAFLNQPTVSPFTGIIDSLGDIGSRCKHTRSDSVRYAFRISAAQMGGLPRILPPSN